MYRPLSFNFQWLDQAGAHVGLAVAYIDIAGAHIGPAGAHIFLPGASIQWVKLDVQMS